MKVTFMPFLCLPFALSYGMSSWPALGYFPTVLLPLTSKDAPPPYASPPPQTDAPALRFPWQCRGRPDSKGVGKARPLATRIPLPKSRDCSRTHSATQPASVGPPIRGRDGLSPQRPSPVRPARPPPTPPAANFPPTHLSTYLPWPNRIEE